MVLISCPGRHALNFRRPRFSAPILWTPSPVLRPTSLSRRRCFHGSGVARNPTANSIASTENWREYRGTYDVPTPTFHFARQIPVALIGKKVTAVGYIGRRRDLPGELSFVFITGGCGTERVQILSRPGHSEDGDKAHRVLKTINANSAVTVTGTLQWKHESKSEKMNPEKSDEGMTFIMKVEMRLEHIQSLNSFPEDIVVGPNQNFGPESRHLQIRFETDLRERLQFRSDLAKLARQELADFQEIETPILFKSTPEGAREFLVPSRTIGHAYALPQSPQQYKQILMASGIHKYVQFAKCFRDEDLRADRQPEFTQIDLEMAWTDGEGVMRRVEDLVRSLFRKLARPGTTIQGPLADDAFIRMTYDEAMSRHGSDKPDLRILALIHRIDHIVPADLRGMLTHLQDPAIEACKFRLNADPKTIKIFISKFMDSPEAEPFTQNPDGAPGVFVFDSRKPLEGLQALGFEGAESLKALYARVLNQALDTEDPRTAAESSTFDDGDLLVVQARENVPHTGGSTALGRLRIAIYKAAILEGLLEPDPTYNFLWVTDFPMFTLDNSSDLGQGGAAGFSATHHPFTAPKTAADVDLLLTDPLKAKADHYDLVVNGVELGGGSRRIHSAEVQKFIMSHILKMSEERINDFAHLFEALRAGCPPHAGLAIGFDRLVAIMQGQNSVRDVIAFPKNSRAEDPMIKSPSVMTEEQQKSYHLQIREST